MNRFCHGHVADGTAFISLVHSMILLLRRVQILPIGSSGSFSRWNSSLLRTCIPVQSLDSELRLY